MQGSVFRGVLNINKPAGITSYDVIRRIKKLLLDSKISNFKIGHAGTLDPIANGVLLILFNEATKIASYLVDLKKEYIAEIKLGVKTDTDDVTGKVLAQKDLRRNRFTTQKVSAILAEFVGEINQVPPVYSALRQQGKRLYELARSNQFVIPKPRTVRIDELELIEFTLPILRIRAVVSKGTYLRALARDIGERLGSYATLVNLTRTKIGDFQLENSLDLTSLTIEKIKDNLCPISSALSNLATVCVRNSAISKVLKGQPIKNSDIINHSLELISKNSVPLFAKVKLVDEAGTIMVIANQINGFLKPIRLIYADLPKTK
ncbi:MAG: tRNA pseudouridine(55) synthase TruB [candidate division WOR-3 bacterium]